MVYAKKADFKQIASEYGIDQVLARIIRNRDICGSKDIDMYLNGNLNDIPSRKPERFLQSLAVERYGKGSGYPAGENRK